MRIMRFTSAVSCGILRPSQRAFGTYLCVYRKEDDHTALDRKSSGWLILSAMWLRRAVSPSRRVGRGRQMLSFVYSPVCLPVIYIFTAYHPLIFTLACIPLPHRIQLFFPHISCPNTAASIASSCAGPPIPPFSPSILPTAPLFFRQLCSVPRPAILTVALSPSPLRYVCSFRKSPF